jgi:hypothetical protein
MLLVLQIKLVLYSTHIDFYCIQQEDYSVPNVKICRGALLMGTLACVLLIRWVTSKPWRINSFQIILVKFCCFTARFYTKKVQMKKHSYLQRYAIIAEDGC